MTRRWKGLRILALLTVCSVIAAAGIIVWTSADAPPLAVRTVAPPDPVDRKRWEVINRQFRTPDSLTLDGAQYVGPSRGTVVLVHGLGDFGAVLSRTAPTLSRAMHFQLLGFSVRGSGASGGPRADAREIASYARDLGTIVADLKRRTPSGPVVLLGLREGAGLALRYIATQPTLDSPPVDGLLLADPIMELTAWDRSTRPAMEQFNGRREWHHRRFDLLALLGSARFYPTDTWPVLHTVDLGPTGPEVQHYTMRALRAMTVNDPWGVLQQSTIPALVLSASVPPGAVIPSDRLQVETLRAGQEITDSAPLAAVGRWAAQFSAAATMPVAPLPYQLLPILPTR